MNIILGSSSRWRRQIMETIIGPEIGFEVMSPDIDERTIGDREKDSPQVLTSRIAMAKCKALRDRITEPAVIITADQVVTCNGCIREKPEDAEQARYFLKCYRTMPAICVTAVYALNTETNWSGLVVDEATVWFKEHLLTNDAIERFIDEKLIFTAAGGFCAGHKSFEPFVLKIQGELESVMGLPKTLTATLLVSALEGGR